MSRYNSDNTVSGLRKLGVILVGGVAVAGGLASIIANASGCDPIGPVVTKPTGLEIAISEIRAVENDPRFNEGFKDNLVRIEGDYSKMANFSDEEKQKYLAIFHGMSEEQHLRYLKDAPWISVPEAGIEELDEFHKLYLGVMGSNWEELKF